MTEQEAKEKWCPFTQVSATIVPTQSLIGVPGSTANIMVVDNRGGTTGKFKCLGTKCMKFIKVHDWDPNDWYCNA